MGLGIIVCGLNGAGKSTLGKALAERLNFYFIDSEDLYFSNTDSNYIYSSPRTHQEAEELFLSKIREHENFVFASVKGSGPFFRYAILIEVPKEIRLKRVKTRSFQKFGDRMLSGGDLYEREEQFFDFVQSKTENTVLEWLESLNCPVIRVDGTKSIEKNVKFIMDQIKNNFPRSTCQYSNK